MKRPLKTAAWCFILYVAISLTSLLMTYFFNYKESFFYNLIGAAGGVLFAVYLYGFVVLGKKFNSLMLLIMAWIGIAANLAFTLLGAFNNFASAQNIDVTSIAPAQNMGLILVAAIIAVIWGVYSILFGIGLIRIGDKVEKAKTAGILEIVAGATMIILVGMVIKIVAYVYEEIMLFRVSGKFEK